MRTTVTIDDDILSAARALAERERRSLGAVLSDLARRSLSDVPISKTRNGIPQLPISRPGVVITTELVKRLEDELP
ncbi:hypothetical protein [Methylopila sp. 73B]|uniref:hypothetical protein n=1 Tax=Methylopila sp. 73B TaxID=1120792 RepID=UPI00037DA13A|nr:hypothetical protein [Methylopila sp. 73B]